MSSFRSMAGAAGSLVGWTTTLPAALMPKYPLPQFATLYVSAASCRVQVRPSVAAAGLAIRGAAPVGECERESC